jgi:23S rRNA pseudouridine1911/1915/1917 synthase
MKTEEKEIEKQIGKIFKQQDTHTVTDNGWAHQFVASQKEEKQRLDRAVADHVADISRAQVTDLIKSGSVHVNNVLIQKPGYRLKVGDTVSITIPSPKPSQPKPEETPLSILYEDKDLLVINKPQGMVVHLGAGHRSGTLVNALLFHCPELEGIGDKCRPGIVHRLDKDTSGCIVVAKKGEAHEKLSQQFKTRSVKKTYLALAYGAMKEKKGTITLPIGRHPVDRKKMSTTSKKGRASETIWKVKKSFQDVTLLEVDIKTGRTHQIRTHLAAINHPVVGDPTYGGKKRRNSISSKILSESLRKINRQMLHAWKLSFQHPRTEETVSVEAPLPEDMKNLLKGLRRYK